MTKRLRWFSVRGSCCRSDGGVPRAWRCGEPLTLRYGQDWSSAHSIFSLPISVAQREGLFAREGLNVQVIIPVPGGSDKMIFDGLNKGWIDVTHIATPFLIRAAMKGCGCGRDQCRVQKRDLQSGRQAKHQILRDLKGKLHRTGRRAGDDHALRCAGCWRSMDWNAAASR